MIKHYETAKYSGLRHEEVNYDVKTTEGVLSVDTKKGFQKMLGFGGAFTEAAAYTLSQMSKENREKVLKAYFDPKQGLNYNIGRVHIHSCDFALENYTYVDDNDTSLESFSIDRDFKWVIPMIKDAEKIRGEKISLLASPWSPPAWMKTNNDMNHGGKLLPEYYQTWANYYVKYLDSYKAAGLDVFGLTVQNEPAAVQVWDSCTYTEEEERDFVKNYLGPTLEKSNHKDTKLIIWDHNRDIIVERAQGVLSDKEASKYVWGTGVHWYVSEAFENLSKVHDLFPDKHILFTEGCIEGGVQLNSFETGERYARNMIGDISNYCEGYLDWNLTLNEMGGPNHVGNYCDAPIIADTKTDQLHFNTSYYAMGHFSKHVLPGATRIASTSSTDDVKQVAFKNPNGEVVIVLQNETENDHTMTLEIDGVNHPIKISKRSISTIKY